ncbi:MAG: radical SAM family heme chaperone HemW [Anaerolineaceae bacterium]|nr:MAG: radical SAM family heme chaperone HemW [Anaerolineaceae bacterium]
MTPDTSIYIHVPFCVHRCAYCDFNTYAGQEDLIPSYVNALIREIEYVRRQLSNLPAFNVPTVFFGGGTPSLLSGSQLVSIMDALRAAFAFPPNLEATIEANPGTTSLEFLHQIREAGINRISFGVQSANPEELHMLERAHDFFDVIRSIQWARQAGFDNLSLDLIYGLPEQTLASWKSTIQRIVDLHPEHISAYALTLEHGTPFGRWSQRGLLPLPDPDLAADMYEFAEEFLAANGYVHYEISNWALNVQRLTFNVQSKFACKHNLQYWRSLPYLGLGAGAHGYADGYRYSNFLRIKTYIERLANYQSPITNYQFPLTPATVNHHEQTLRDDMSEYMLNNLRLLIDGVSESDFKSRFGHDLMEVYPKEIEELLRFGLLERVIVEDATHFTFYVLRLTPSARLLANQVFMRFVD